MNPRALLVTALLATACGGKNPGAYHAAAEPAPAAGADVAAVLGEADALWAERLDEGKLRAALDKYGEAHALDPKNRHALQRLTRGWYFLGDSHLTEKEDKLAAWGRAIEFGKQCLALNEDFATRVQTEKEKDAVAAATKEDAPCLYWTASALGKWGKAQGVAKVLGLLPTVKAYIAKVEELDPEFFHYGPARYWGAYYSASSFTWDEEKSRSYFQASIDGAPYYLPTRGLRAEQLAAAPSIKDFDMFATDLAYIRDFDVQSYPELIPELIPENTLEKRKAEALWAQRRELFPEETVDAWEQAHPQ